MTHELVVGSGRLVDPANGVDAVGDRDHAASGLLDGLQHGAHLSHAL